MVRLLSLTVWAYSSAVEPPAHNRLVPGSNPGGPTNPKLLSYIRKAGVFLAIKPIRNVSKLCYNTSIDGNTSNRKKWRNMSKFCIHCGSKLEDTDKFCMHCGAKCVDAGQPAAPVDTTSSAAQAAFEKAEQILLSSKPIPDYSQALVQLVQAKKLGIKTNKMETLMLLDQLYRTIDMLRQFYGKTETPTPHLTETGNDIGRKHMASSSAQPAPHTLLEHRQSNPSMQQPIDNRSSAVSNSNLGTYMKAAAIGAVTGAVANTLLGHHDVQASDDMLNLMRSDDAALTEAADTLPDTDTYDDTNDTTDTDDGSDNTAYNENTTDDTFYDDTDSDTSYDDSENDNWSDTDDTYDDSDTDSSDDYDDGGDDFF